MITIQLAAATLPKLLLLCFDSVINCLPFALATTAVPASASSPLYGLHLCLISISQVLSRKTWRWSFGITWKLWHYLWTKLQHVIDRLVNEPAIGAMTTSATDPTEWDLLWSLDVLFEAAFDLVARPVRVKKHLRAITASHNEVLYFLVRYLWLLVGRGGTSHGSLSSGMSSLVVIPFNIHEPTSNYSATAAVF